MTSFPHRSLHPLIYPVQAHLGSSVPFLPSFLFPRLSPRGREPAVVSLARQSEDPKPRVGGIVEVRYCASDKYQMGGSCARWTINACLMDDVTRCPKLAGLGAHQILSNTY
jgi:hypothetical protein